MENTYSWNISGHEKIVAGLEKELMGGNLAHAYLFAGPAGVGKYTVAKTFAHILQCEKNCGHFAKQNVNCLAARAQARCRRQAGGAPLGSHGHSCAVCNEIEKGYHSDTLEISDNNESIKIETVRDLLPKLHMSKQSPRKILLIQNIERMTPGSANAMLKTLEDPPDGVMFLLTTSRIKEVLPTIISRVRVINFQRLSEKEIISLLQKHYPLAETDLLGQVSSFGAGKPGKAMAFMSQPKLLSEARKMYTDVCNFVKNPDRIGEFTYIADIVKTAKEQENDAVIYDFLDIFTAVLRQEMIGRAKGYHAAGAGNAKGGGIEKILWLITEAQKAQDLLKRNVNKRLLLENLVINLGCFTS